MSVAWMLRLRDVLLTLSQRRKVLEASEITGRDNGGQRNDTFMPRCRGKNWHSVDSH